MKLDDVRSERIGLLDRLKVRCRRCPYCSGRLVNEEDRDAIAAWTHVPEKHTVRVIGSTRMMGFPRTHSVDISRCKRCTACGRWYIGRWSYRQAGASSSQRESPGTRQLRH